MMHSRLREGAALYAGLAMALLVGCTVPSMLGNEDDGCAVEGSPCGAGQLCCGTLACSNGLCVAELEDDPDGGSPDDPDGPGEAALADFAAEDVNPASPRFGQMVSPRDHLGQVSAWYFGHST